MYVENPNSGVAKAKVIKHEVEVNTFLYETSIRSVVLKKMNSFCIICIKQLIHGDWKGSFLIALQWVSRSHDLTNRNEGKQLKNIKHPLTISLKILYELIF